MMHKKRIEAMELNDYGKILIVRSGRNEHFKTVLKALAARFPSALIDVLALEKMKEELEPTGVQPLEGARNVKIIYMPGENYSRENIPAASGKGGPYDLVALLYNNVFGRGYRGIERSFLGGGCPVIGVDRHLNYTVVTRFHSVVKEALPAPLLKALCNIRYLAVTAAVIIVLLAAEAVLFIPALVKKAIAVAIGGTAKK